MSTKRVIFLSQLYDPEPSAKGNAFIESLAEAGLETEVVTGFPNYPGGKIYDGYKIRALKRDSIGKTPVTRLAMYPSHDSSALKRIVTYFSFMFAAIFYLVFRAKRADIIYAYYPALTSGLAAVVAKLFRRTPIILDVQDMWPDSLGSSGMVRNRVVLWLANRACNTVYRFVDHIVVLSPGFKDLLVERGVPAGKISVVYNWTQESPRPEPGAAIPAGMEKNDSFRVLFAGNMGAAQDLDTAIEAAKLLAETKTDCVLYFLGGGVGKKTLEKQAKELGLENVRFLPRVSSDEVQEYLAAADALLVHLVDDPLFRITIPSKTQAYLYAGRPVLMGVAGNAADLIAQAGAGYAFSAGDAEDLATKIKILIEDGSEKRAEMGRRGHDFYMQRLQRKTGIADTVALIRGYCR